jgi:Rrf2 family cysteine metabolism transcriptional repressor
MKVNTKVRYGLRAMLQIAKHYGEDPLPISTIAKSQDISGKYLEQVVVALRKADLINSHKGVRGGYTLTRDPAEITLWDIISALDSHTALVDCVVDPSSCERSQSCLSHVIWKLLSQRMQEFWASYTLQDLIEKVDTAEVMTTGQTNHCPPTVKRMDQ